MLAYRVDRESYRKEKIVEQIRDLPTLPSIVYELGRVVNDPMSSTKEVEDIMSKDQSMTTKVLKLVNSAYYSIPGGVSTLSRAVAFLGFDTVHQLVLCASVVDQLKIPDAQFNLKDFWAHSMGVAVGAETIAKRVSHPVPSEAFMAGLVHDLGKVVMLSLEPELFLYIVQMCEEEGLSFIEAEKKLEIEPHTWVGAFLAEHWKLPDFLAKTIKYHHQPEVQSRVGVGPDDEKLIDLVYLSNVFIHALKFGHSGHKKVINAKKEVFDRLSLQAEADLKPTLLAIRSSLDQAGDFLRILGS